MNFQQPTIIIDKNYKIEKTPEIICYKEALNQKYLNRLGIQVYSLKKNIKLKTKHQGHSVQNIFLEKKSFQTNQNILRLQKIPINYLIFVDLENAYAWIVGRKAKPIYCVKVDKQLIDNSNFNNRKKETFKKRVTFKAKGKEVSFIAKLNKPRRRKFQRKAYTL